MQARDVLTEAADKMAVMETGDVEADHGDADKLLLDVIGRLAEATGDPQTKEEAGRLARKFDELPKWYS